MLDIGAAFLVGLLGSGHCAAMCGGIATALEMALDPRDRGRVAARAAYQVGRLCGYAVAGAVAGGLGTGLFALAARHTALAVSQWLTALLMILLGLYLSGLWRAPLASVERVGLAAWQALAPLRARMLPVRTVVGALRMGVLWGFLPCGLVYSALALALASGDAVSGALTMLAFGAGTVPALVLITGAAGRVVTARAGPLRTAAGVAILLAGIALSIHAAHR